MRECTSSSIINPLDPGLYVLYKYPYNKFMHYDQLNQPNGKFAQMKLIRDICINIIIVYSNANATELILGKVTVDTYWP